MDIQISTHAREKALERIGPDADLRAIWRKSSIAQSVDFIVFQMWEIEGFEYRVAEHLGERYMMVIDDLDQRVVTVVKRGGRCEQKTKPR